MGEGGIRSAVTVHLSFWDRVRVLFGARMVVYLDVRVEKDPGRMVSEESHVEVGEPKTAQMIAQSPR
jgi:hypothetical protein